MVVGAQKSIEWSWSERSERRVGLKPDPPFCTNARLWTFRPLDFKFVFESFNPRNLAPQRLLAPCLNSAMTKPGDENATYLVVVIAPGS